MNTTAVLRTLSLFIWQSFRTGVLLCLCVLFDANLLQAGDDQNPFGPPTPGASFGSRTN